MRASPMVACAAVAVPGLLLLPARAFAQEAGGPVMVLGIPLDFILFGLTLLGVALFHRRTFEVAVTGLVVVSLYKILFTGFEGHPGVAGFMGHLGEEWVILTNLFCLLMGFGLLSRHFEDSEVPAVLPKYLPDDWKGGLLLLVFVFVLSSFLDNIAAALIGAATAHTVFKGKIHIGYLAGIVAASNAGGAGSVIGDTTTTMIWLSGVSPLKVLPGYVAAFTALVIAAIPAAKLQQRHAPIVKDAARDVHVDRVRLTIVATVLVAAIVTNMTVNLRFQEAGNHFPFIGAAVAITLLVLAPLRRPAWEILPSSLKGTIFLLSLVTIASMMPVEELPGASWQTAFGLGFLSSVFDNIPLTALAITQGGYDWAMLAYTVGFGGSMIWFGSSAGVAVSNMFPEAKSVGRWLRHGWFVTAGYVVGFLAYLFIVGWNP